MLLEDLISIVKSFEAIVKKCAGPRGMNNMIITSTGQMMLTTNGYTILNHLNLDHPLGKMILLAVSSHCHRTGDGSKAFVLMLSGALQELKKITSSVESPSLDHTRRVCIDVCFGLKRLLQSLQDIVLPELMSKSVVATHTEDMRDVCQRVIRGTLFGCRRSDVDSLSEMITEYILENEDLAEVISEDCRDTCNTVVTMGNKDRIEATSACIQWAVDNFEFFCIKCPNRPPSHSEIIQGFILQRDFAVDMTSAHTQVRFVLMDALFDPETENITTMATQDKQSAIRRYSTWKTDKISEFLDHLQQQGVNLVISTCLSKPAVRYLCRQRRISVIDAVPSEDVTLLSHALSLGVIYDMRDLDKVWIGRAIQCKRLAITGRCVHICTGDKKVRQLLVCGINTATCSQTVNAILNSFKSLKMLLSPDHQLSNHDTAAIPANGTFEYTVIKCLNAYTTNQTSESDVFAGNILKAALLNVPRTVVQNSSQNEREGRRKFLQEYRNLEPSACCAALHPVHSKMTLVYDVTQLLCQLLRIDTIVPSKRLKDE